MVLVVILICLCAVWLCILMTFLVRLWFMTIDAGTFSTLVLANPILGSVPWLLSRMVMFVVLSLDVSPLVNLNIVGLPLAGISRMLHGVRRCG